MKLDAISKRVGIPEPRREQPAPSVAPGGSLAALLDGTVSPIGGTCSFVRHVQHDGAHLHGQYAFSDIRSVTPRRIAIVTGDAELDYVDLSGAVFLDTETTGLGMGVGTYVFLVGAGYQDGDGFSVRQFFLHSPSEESSFLQELAAFLSRFSAIVTFNGKAFDWPLIENRFTFHRSRVPLTDPPHVDLLHPARRLWKRRLESCALTSLEREILGIERTEEDVPGFLIPSLYFDYLHRGESAALARVFYHNLHDILSLATLAVHIDRVLSDPFAAAHSIDLYCAGRIFERAGDIDLASQCYEEALARGIQGTERQDSLVRLSITFKRTRRWDRAMRVWEQLVDDGGESAIVGLVEMSKYYEHVEAEYLSALDAVQGAIVLRELNPAPQADIGLVDLEHRRGRLLSKVYRERSWVEGGRERRRRGKRER